MSTKVRQEFYRRMTGEQLGAALGELSLSVEAFAWLTGTNRANVQRWMKNEQDIPPWVTTWTVMATVPEARRLAVEATRRFSMEREPDGAV